MAVKNELIIRADDIVDEDLLEFYVGSSSDQVILQHLINREPILLVGSRGCGKTMLLRIAEKRMENSFKDEKVLPVFITFKQAALIEPRYFKQWMISKVLFALKRKLKKMCNFLCETSVLEEFLNVELPKRGVSKQIDQLISLLENSWRNKNCETSNDVNNLINNENSFNVLNEMDYFQALIEDICHEFSIRRIVFLFDEACHNFIQSQQREFFTLFRDMRSPYINCKAAVYPGITFYGNTFQKFHDATEIKIERNISDPNYIITMREIVNKQVDDDIFKRLVSNGELLNLLIYASSGNPRILLKSLNQATNNLSIGLKTQDVINTIKEFYRTDIWNEHIMLREKYIGHKKLIDWGREFIENKVLEDIFNKNTTYLDKGNQTIYFAIERDSPEAVKQAIKILEHSGIISINKEGIKKAMGMRSRILDRYQINLGIILSSEKNGNIQQRCKVIVDNLTTEICSFYTLNSPSFDGVENLIDIKVDDNFKDVIQHILGKSIDELDIYHFMKQSIKNEGFNTLGDILNSSEGKLQKAHLIGEIRARRIYNTALNATIEYISG